MESDIDSRFINNKQGRWSVTHGPMSEDFFTSLEEISLAVGSTSL